MQSACLYIVTGQRAYKQPTKHTHQNIPEGCARLTAYTIATLSFAGGVTEARLQGYDEMQGTHAWLPNSYIILNKEDHNKWFHYDQEYSSWKGSSSSVEIECNCIELGWDT